ncbi:MAG: hypothetical protein K2N58_05185 [Treponemataceae bacterium]|nr:hypothetical protein [Treponemataceae bacterium]
MKNWIEQFISEEPPYKVFKINSNQLYEICDLQNFSIEQYCDICRKPRTFKSIDNSFKEILNEYQFRGREFFKYNFEEFVEYDERCIILDFQCQHDCGEHHYFAIKIRNLTIQKIGQYPTFAKEEVSKNLIKYKSLIPKYYPELTKAVSAYSQNMGVPAFVYLRRILEHLVDAKAMSHGIKTEQKFVDKLKDVEKSEKVIPTEFEEIKNQLYTVLSKGIHEYEEEECIEMFSAVKFIIESILDAELIKKEHEQKVKEAKAIIQKKLNKEIRIETNG